MPIVVKCNSLVEANAALGLQAIFKRLGCEKADQQPEVFARAVASSTQIPDLFATQGPFYAVYNGKTQRAIFVRNRKDYEAQVHGHMYAKHRRFETIKEALVYMILKGDMAKMRTLDTNDLPEPASQSQPLPKPKIIYSHIRDLTGIVDTIYGSTSSKPDYALYNLGRHASNYLQAHGYTGSTIKEIENIWASSGSVDNFSARLVPLGMAATEVQWLWELIHHDDNCGF
ncbi:hypothetical protein B0H15DRAFT_806525 [Mycena belliarum]|uniref:Ribonuclease H1 N-terminal domain-containing protein n=1 Tax=Mycena belliarum TaxID=1033014 RepID=A0AAD6TNR6_9AGAR|nr:hypothetical protein B0H15DRAFT_806525 [Mycena belliae]